MSKWFLLSAAVAALPLCATADTVELINGDMLHGTITEQTEDGVVIEHPILGTVNLPTDQISAVIVLPEGAEQDGPLEQAATEVKAPEEQAPAISPKAWSNKILPGWDKHFEVGFSGTDGNTQTSNVSLGFAALQENEQERSNLKFSYFRTEDDGIRTRNEATGELVHDWLMPDSPWFKFASGKIDYDEFQDWETRASGFVGVGKQLQENDKHSVIGRAGLGASYEFGTVNELVPEALLGLEWVYTINDQQTLESYVTVFPNLDEFGESRTIAGTAWTIAIDEADGISLKLGIDNEYESMTEGTAKHNDVKYYGALVFDF